MRMFKITDIENITTFKNLYLLFKNEIKIIKNNDLFCEPY